MSIFRGIKNFVFQKGYDEEYYDEDDNNEAYSYEDDDIPYIDSRRGSYERRNSEVKRNDNATITLPNRTTAKAKDDDQSQVYALGAISGGHKIVISSPKNIDEASYVSDCLKENKTVIVNLDEVDTKDSQRIMDFISGVTYSISGDVQPVSTRIFIVSPKNVEVTEHLKEQLKANGIFPGFGLRTVFAK